MSKRRTDRDGVDLRTPSYVTSRQTRHKGSALTGLGFLVGSVVPRDDGHEVEWEAGTHTRFGLRGPWWPTTVPLSGSRGPRPDGDRPPVSKDKGSEAGNLQLKYFRDVVAQL